MKLNHFDEAGNAVMADVGGKEKTERQAVAAGKITMSPEAFARLRSGTAKKGDVLNVARIAGIMASKKTPDLIPLCHIIQITSASLDFELNEEDCAATAVCTVKSTGETGVEMEALTGVSVALLTVYDMLKAADRSMEITDIRLLKKSGGKSGDFER